MHNRLELDAVELRAAIVHYLVNVKGLAVSDEADVEIRGNVKGKVISKIWAIAVVEDKTPLDSVEVQGSVSEK